MELEASAGQRLSCNLKISLDVVGCIADKVHFVLGFPYHKTRTVTSIALDTVIDPDKLVKIVAFAHLKGRGLFWDLPGNYFLSFFKTELLFVVKKNKPLSVSRKLAHVNFPALSKEQSNDQKG